MYLVYQFNANEDPTLLSQTLWRLKISHQVTTENGHKELWLVDPQYQIPVQQLLQLWKEQPEKLTSVQRTDQMKGSARTSGVGVQIRRAPATALVILAAIIVALITQLGSDVNAIQYFTISPFDVVGNQIRFYNLSDVLAQGQYWRLLSPALLHFSVMHIAFNVLWVWDIGRRIEERIGTILWLLGVAVIAIVSNILQYQLTHNPLFGGLSGVVYGLIAFAWLVPMLNKRWPVIITRPLMFFFVIWLAIGYTAIPESLGLGKIANTAHAIGLFAGLALALVYGVISRFRQAS